MHTLDSPAPVRLALTRERDADRATCWINVQDRGLVGRRAELQVVITLTDMANGKRREKVEFSQVTWLRSGRQRYPLPPSLSVYLFYGARLSLRPVLRLVGEGGKTIAQRSLIGGRVCLVGGRPRLHTCADSLMQPKDVWSLFANFSALAVSARARVLLVGFAALALALANLGVGFHDQFHAEQPRSRQSLALKQSNSDAAPTRAPILYRPHRRGQPISDAAIWSLLMVTLGWASVRHQFKRYAWLEINLMLPPLRPGLRLPANQVVRGRTDTAIRHAVLRVVAANLECSENKQGRHIVVRREPSRAVLLYERELRYLPAGSSIDAQLDGDIDFSPLFEALYPPIKFDARWGVDVAWQVQLLHPDLIDLAVEGPVHSLRFVDFLAPAANPVSGVPA